MGDFWFVWVEDRIQVFFDVLYQVFTRFALLMVWLPFALILMLPVLYDGLMIWKIKKTTFDFSNPSTHRYSMIILGPGVYGIVHPISHPYYGVTVSNYCFSIDVGVGVKSLAEDIRPQLIVT